ncbi:unnamed protein product [Gordionus sp. m RMFG-2023]|uniref:TRPL translocation defect protein 14-like n=1 Tax=Gordionus sp. m RMFG-2023 TaxID=3053472 RepID=UPI0030E38688
MEALQKEDEDFSQTFKIVLTGGPCGGKTTGQSRLHIFFENIGWKVYRVPETATLLLGGGISFEYLTKKQAIKFQENLLRTMMQLEKSFFDVVCVNPHDIKYIAEKNTKNYPEEASQTVNREFNYSGVNKTSINHSNALPINNSSQKTIIICDRGTMDPAAYMKEEEFNYILRKNSWTIPLLRDNRYDQVIHMVSAANGAEDFYTCQGNAARHEGLDRACEVDKKTADVWIGHPYFDIIDNSTGFEAKILRLISVVCRRLGIETGESLKILSRKKKFLIINFNEDDPTLLKLFPPNQVFTVVHDYLLPPDSDDNHSKNMLHYKKLPQIRLRKRGILTDGNMDNYNTINNHNFTFTHTVRKPEIKGQAIEIKRQIDAREYSYLLQSQRDRSHFTIYKTRRCFLYDNHYYRLDVYQKRSPKSCKGLVLLETYTTKPTSQLKLPNFLTMAEEVTGKPEYSMWNLSLKDDKKFDSNVLMDCNQNDIQIQQLQINEH